MSPATRTVVTFTSSAFNTTEPKDYFINPCCFGDDLARWLIEQLKSQGVETDDGPGQEDFGWYVRFTVNNMPHWFVVSFRPSDEIGGGEWIAAVERSGFLRLLARRSGSTVDNAAIEVIHRTLSEASMIDGVRWHSRSDFDPGDEDAGQPTP